MRTVDKPSKTEIRTCPENEIGFRLHRSDVLKRGIQQLNGRIAVVFAEETRFGRSLRFRVRHTAWKTDNALHAVRGCPHLVVKFQMLQFNLSDVTPPNEDVPNQ